MYNNDKKNGQNIILSIRALKQAIYTLRNKDLFEMCYYWEELISTLNSLREKYLETKDYSYFRAIRQILPMSFKYTSMFDCNYATLRNIYAWRRNHKLSEWHKFCDWILTLPLAELLIVGD